MGRRRSGLPAAIKAELPSRANAGVGLDPEFPTRTTSGVCRAAVACHHRPSPDMVALVRDVMNYLTAANAQQVRLLQNYRDQGQPGALTVAWTSGPPAAETAERFAVSTAECGTPRLPSWLSLRADDDFDLRWQPPF